jgi:hypothetical protein
MNEQIRISIAPADHPFVAGVPPSGGSQAGASAPVSRPLAAVLGLLALLLAATGLCADEASAYGAKDDLLPGGAGIAVKGGIVFTTAGAESFAKAKRLVAIDVANPAAPKVVSSVELKGFPQDLALAGNIAYVVDGMRLVAIDIANPAAMRIVYETAVADAPEYGLQGIVLDGNDAYLACRRKGVVTVDISKPEAPVVKAAVATPFSRGVALCQVAGKTFLVSADDTQGLNVILGNRIVASQRLKRGSAARVRVDGDKVFVANGGSFLAVFTMAPDGKLSPHAEFTTVPDGGYYGSYAYDVLPVGKYAVLAAGENGILPVDLSDPAKPFAVVGAGKVPDVPLVRAVVREGDWLFVNGGTMDGRTLFFTLDAKDWPAFKMAGEPLNLSE